MNTLKPCPFCGGTKICTEKGINLNYCDNCSAESNVEHWNTRPIEDDLRNRIAELEEKQRWIPVGEKPKIGQYCAVIQLDKYGQFIEGGYAIYYGESSEYAMEVWKNITHWYPVPNWNAIKMPEEIQ